MNEKFKNQIQATLREAKSKFDALIAKQTNAAARAKIEASFREKMHQKIKDVYADKDSEAATYALVTFERIMNEGGAFGNATSCRTAAGKSQASSAESAQGDECGAPCACRISFTATSVFYMVSLLNEFFGLNEEEPDNDEAVKMLIETPKETRTEKICYFRDEKSWDDESFNLQASYVNPADEGFYESIDVLNIGRDEFRRCEDVEKYQLELGKDSDGNRFARVRKKGEASAFCMLTACYK